MEIDYGNTFIISIFKSDLTYISKDLYELNVNSFRLTLKSFEADETGIVFPKTHLHNTEIILAGITFIRTVALLQPYSVQFENGKYSVRLVGANNNLYDVGGGVLISNQVQVIPTYTSQTVFVPDFGDIVETVIDSVIIDDDVSLVQIDSVGVV